MEGSTFSFTMQMPPVVISGQAPENVLNNSHPNDAITLL